MPFRVLYLTHRVPYPPDKGDRIRNWHVLRQLTQSFRVSLGCLADEPTPQSTIHKLSEICKQVSIEPISRFGRLSKAGFSFLKGRSLSEGAFYSRNLSRTIRHWHAGEPFDAIIVSATSLTPYQRMPEFRTVPAFVDVVDVDSQKWFDFAEAVRFPKSWLYRIEACRVRKIEHSLPSWAQASVLVSRAEAEVFESIAGPGSALVATNGVDLEYFQPGDSSTITSPIVAFVGALDYLPNIDAAVWFTQHVWPRIRSAIPAAEFRLIGRNPARAVQELSSVPGVNLIGGVPDVRPYLQESAVVVVPMRLSRGLQNKVLEALAMGKATVVAPPALAALEAKPGVDLVRAESPDEWSRVVIDLLNNPLRCNELGRKGREFVESKHHWGSCLNPMITAITHACSAKLNRREGDVAS